MAAGSRHPTNSSLGFLDPARLSQLDDDGRLLSGDAPTKELPLHSALYDDPPGRRRHRASAFHPLRRGLDAAGRRSCQRAPTHDRLLRHARRPHRPRAVLPAGRSGRCRCDPRACRAIQRGSPRQSWPVVAGKDLEAAVYATEELEETAKLRLLLHGLNPRSLKPGTGSRSRHTFQAGSSDCRGHARGRAELLLPRLITLPTSADEFMPRFSANLGFLFTEHPEIERIAAAAAAGFKAVEMHWPYQVPAAEMQQRPRAQRDHDARTEHTRRQCGRGRFRAGCLAGTRERIPAGASTRPLSYGRAIGAIGGPLHGRRCGGGC